MAVKKRTYSGTTNNAISQREIDNRNLSRMAADEGVVLLKNSGILPVTRDKKIAIYGNGIAKIMKGGTGSGDVNERAVVSMLEGLLTAGYTVVNEDSARKLMADFAKSEEDRRIKTMEKLEELKGSSDMEFLNVITNTKGSRVKPIHVTESELQEAYAAVVIISRVAGEGQDRFEEVGDYYLTEEEIDTINQIEKYNQNIILLINTGAQIDISEMSKRESIKGIVYISQPGMEAGHVIADIISGQVNPSGKLTTTWSRAYSDFPNAKTFSHCNGNVDKEYYNEGIYVGYRYFDSFGVEPLYPFGYGLSYTNFEFSAGSVSLSGNNVLMKVTVSNTGNCPGKDVVQFYAACPQGRYGKEMKKLVGFAKTSLLKPGECQTLEVSAEAKNFAMYDQEASAWVAESGDYGIFAGEDSRDIELIGMLHIKDDVILEEVAHILPLKEHLEEIHPKADVISAFTEKWHREAQEKGIQSLDFAPVKEVRQKLPESKYMPKARELAEQMEDQELTAMLMGEITKGQDNIRENELVTTGIYVPGAAGETSCRLETKYDIPAVSMADGPAGLRVMRSYDVDNETGLIYGQGLLSALEGGFFAKDYHRENVTTYHMYATAIPIGTLLAQTWNTGLIEKVGHMVAGEMEEFGISWWLAPGMNIHRNPLCGRNFEYYSEEPVLAGAMGAAMTKGVQSVAGRGTTIKHFACNNQEDNRLHSDSILSERALRELYLRNFEIAVRQAQPKCLMTSYNLINSVPAANSYDLITEVLRNEWDFQGIVMTDWTTTTGGSATSYKCAEAGNDLIMPGSQIDVDNIMEALQNGSLSRDKARECVARLIAAVMEACEQ